MNWRRSIVALGLAVALVVGVAAPPARAQDAAAQFRQVIDSLMNELSTRTNGQLRAQTSRAIEVREQGGTVVATLPDLAIVGSGGALNVGTVIVTQTQPAPGRMRYEAQLPREMRASSAGRNPDAVITNGGGRFAVVIDPATKLIHEVDLRVENLAVQPPNQRGSFTLGLLELTSAITQRADGLADSPGHFRLQNLRFQDPASRSTLNIGEIVLAGGVLGFRMADMERVRAAMEEAQRAPQAEQVRRMLDALSSFAFSSLTSELTVANVEYGDGGPAPAVQLGRATFTQTLSSFAAPEARYDFRYAQEGLQIRQGMFPFQQYVPAQIVVALSVEKVPVQALMRIVGGLPTDASGAPSFTPQAAEQMLGAVFQSGATMRIAPIQMMSQALGVTLNGQVAANAQSPLRAVGNGELVVRGLEALLRDLGVTNQPGGQPGAQQGGGGMGAMIGPLVALGQQGTGPDGQPTRTYRVELTADGRLMLNGSDMSALIGPRTTQQPTTPPRPPQQPQTPGGGKPGAQQPQTPGGGKPGTQTPGGGGKPSQQGPSRGK